MIATEELVPLPVAVLVFALVLLPAPVVARLVVVATEGTSHWNRSVPDVGRAAARAICKLDFVGGPVRGAPAARWWSYELAWATRAMPCVRTKGGRRAHQQLAPSCYDSKTIDRALRRGSRAKRKRPRGGSEGGGGEQHDEEEAREARRSRMNTGTARSLPTALLIPRF